MNSMTHNSLVHKFIPVPQAMKIPGAKVGMAADESQKQESSDR